MLGPPEELKIHNYELWHMDVPVLTDLQELMYICSVGILDTV